MKLFEDLPSTNTPINVENLNQIKDNLVVVSATEPTGDNREKVWIQKGKNIFNIDTMVEFVGKHRAWDTGWFIAETGVYDGIKFPVTPNTNYAFSTDATEHLGVAFYDKNFNYISGLPFPNATEFTTPENCYFVTLAVKNDYTWIQVEYGSFITPYEAYVEQKIYVKNDNDVYEEFISKDGLVNYSTEEQIIGTWIDGKTLYRKVLKITGQQISYADMNVNEIVDVKIKSYCNDILFFTGRYNSSADMFTWYLNHIQKIIAIDIGETWLPNYTGSTIILEYTKTTD